MSGPEKPKYTIRLIAMIGIMAALTFAATLIQIPIPTPIDKTRLHPGNVLCLLSGFLLGPVPGGLAAGIGSMFFDLTDPVFIPYAPFTFAFKFLMAFVCGKIAFRKQGRYRGHMGHSFLAAACGAFVYVVLYLAQTFLYDIFFLRTEWQTALIDIATKAISSGFNAILAFLAAVPLAFAVEKGLRKTGLYSELW